MLLQFCSLPKFRTFVFVWERILKNDLRKWMSQFWSSFRLERNRWRISDVRFLYLLASQTSILVTSLFQYTRSLYIFGCKISVFFAFSNFNICYFQYTRSLYIILLNLKWIMNVCKILRSRSSKTSYTIGELLSLAEVNVTKELPTEFDRSILRWNLHFIALNMKYYYALIQL